MFTRRGCCWFMTCCISVLDVFGDVPVHPVLVLVEPLLADGVLGDGVDQPLPARIDVGVTRLRDTVILDVPALRAVDGVAVSLEIRFVDPESA